MQKEAPLEVPTTVDLRTKQKANFEADMAIMTDTVDLNPLDEKQYNGPEIRYSLSGSNKPVSQPVSQVQFVAKDGPGGDKKPADYRDKLSDEHKDLYDSYLAFEDKLPVGFTAVDLLEAKLMYKDIYLLELASGVYVYRALSAAENTRIRNIKGMTQSMYPDHVVANCVIAPRFNITDVDKAKLAGTKNTLYEQILAYSDFATDQTVSIKI